MRHTILAIISSYVISPLISIPIYMSLNIKEFNITVYSNETIADSIIEVEKNLTIYKVWPSELAENHEMLYLWIYSIIIKLLPCITLTYLSLQLVKALYEAKKRKEKLTGNISIKLLSKKKQADRTTKMLIAVLLLFLITEFPQGIMGLLSAFLHKEFYHFCYQKLGKQKQMVLKVDTGHTGCEKCETFSSWRNQLIFHLRQIESAPAACLKSIIFCPI